MMQLAIVAVCYMGLRALSGTIGAAPTLVIDGVALVALPASIAALGVGDAYWQAIYPLALWLIMRALGLSYVGIVAVVLLYGYGIAALESYALAPAWVINARRLRLLWPISACSRCWAAACSRNGPRSGTRPFMPRNTRRVARSGIWIASVRASSMACSPRPAAAISPAPGTALRANLATRDHGFDTYDWLLERFAAA